MRKCIYTQIKNNQSVEVEAMFHQWGYDIIEGDTNSVFTVGIIEDDTGQVFSVMPERIKFTEGWVEPK